MINAYLIFWAISFISLATVVIKLIKLYLSLQDTGSLNSLSAFASTSMIGAALIFISALALALICILLGNRIRKIDLVEKKLFTLLGFSFIFYGIISLVVTVTSIGNENIPTLLKAVLAILIGLILKKVYTMDSSVLYSSVGVERMSAAYDLKPKLENKDSTERKLENTKKSKSRRKKEEKIEMKETSLGSIEIPNINLNELENKEIVLSYFENLSDVELSRLELIVAKKYNPHLTIEQKTNLIINHIAENKLYDHQRYAPK